MNNKEKAKAYNEALNGMREIYPELYGAAKKYIEHFFPQLAAENQDEWIRTEIIDFIQWAEDRGMIRHDYHQAKRPAVWIAYLEKQRVNTEGAFGRGYDCGYQAGYAVAVNEMKPKVATPTLDSEKQKEHQPIPDKFSGLKSLMLQYLQSAANRKDDTEIKRDTDLWGRKILYYVWKYSDEQKEQKPKDITLSREDCLHQLFENGTITLADYLYLTTNRRKQKPAEKQDYSGLNDLERAILRGFLSAGVENVPVTIIKETTKECLAQMKPEEWSEEDEKMLNSIINIVCGVGIQSNGWLRKKQVSWLKSLPERFNLQPKEEWREEKKQTTKNTHPEEYPSSPAECISPREYGLFKQLQQECIETIEQELYSLGKEHEKDDDLRIKFLKSISPSWKPSEEQMSMLLAVINDPNNAGAESCYMALKSIYNNLKKL